MEKSNGLSLELIVHPGETIKELLNDKNMSQEELAIRTCYSAKHISEVLSGKKSISSKFANALEYVFGIPTEFWINLQGIYDKEILELEKLNNIKEEEFTILNELKDIVKYCESYDIIASGLNKSLKVLTMRKFLEVNDLTVISHLSFDQIAFRTSKKVKVNTNVLYAWKRLCEYLTENIDVERNFNKEILKSKCIDIKNTMFLDAKEMVSQLKKIFSECGIVFAIVHHFAGAPVQGFIQRKKDKVILCMTIRQAFSDIFWFTLFHEIGHLLNEDFDNQYIDYNFTDNEIEKKADLFARNFLINENDYQAFIATGKLNINTINNFAKTQNVLPSIVIGRIQNDIKDYTFLASYRDKYKWV